MDCRETQTLLTAFHDGELPAADRARMDEHLRGCPGCAALLADLARADRAAGVPDPGPAYWDRFNARVMKRVEREADGPKVTVLRPKGGWMRQQLRYLVPAAAAAALVVVIVRLGGMEPGAPVPTAPPAANERVAPNERAVAEPDPRAAKKAETAAVPRPVPSQGLAEKQLADVPREEDRNLAAARSLQERNAEVPRDRAAPPAAMSAPAPPPMAYRSAPAVSPPVPAEKDAAGGMRAERKKMAEDAAVMADRQSVGKAKSAAGMKMASGLSAETPPAAAFGETRLKAGSSPVASALSRSPSPCELARTLAGQERFREAEAAQKACLSQDPSPPAREKGLVFLAELLDRQARFAEADAVIAEVDRKYPQSRPLDLYRQQRPMVQKQPAAAPVTR